MAKLKHRYTMRGIFYGAKAYIRYVEYHEKCHDAVNRCFYDAINNSKPTIAASPLCP